jgi:hypothetical protein
MTEVFATSVIPDFTDVFGDKHSDFSLSAQNAVFSSRNTERRHTKIELLCIILIYEILAGYIAGSGLILMTGICVFLYGNEASSR